MQEHLAIQNSTQTHIHTALGHYGPHYFATVILVHTCMHTFAYTYK